MKSNGFLENYLNNEALKITSSKHYDKEEAELQNSFLPCITSQESEIN